MVAQSYTSAWNGVFCARPGTDGVQDFTSSEAVYLAYNNYFRFGNGYTNGSYNPNLLDITVATNTLAGLSYVIDHPGNAMLG